MKWLSYGWSVIVNCFYLFIVVFVLDRLNGHADTAVVVSILGLIYVTLRNIAIGQAILSVETLFHLNKKLLILQSRLNDPAAGGELEEMKVGEEMMKRRIVKLYIDGCFLWLISIACLITLFTKLPSSAY